MHRLSATPPLAIILTMQPPPLQVAAFIDRFHAGRAKVYNLCSERQYDASALGGPPVARLPFDDHQVR